MKYLILICVFLGGCVHFQQVRGPNPAKTTYHISCPRDLALCYDQAGELCPTGYDIVGQGNNHVPLAARYKEPGEETRIHTEKVWYKSWWFSAIVLTSVATAITVPYVVCSSTPDRC